MNTQWNELRPADAAPGKHGEMSRDGIAKEVIKGAAQKIEDVKQGAGDVVGRLIEGSDSFKERITRGANALRKKGLLDTLADAGEFAKKNPGKVILASLAVGWVIGAFRRRDG